MANLLVEPTGTGGRLPRWVRHPVGLGLASAVFLWLSFPPAEWHGAAWIALVPLFLVVTDPGRSKLNLLGVWSGGFVFWLLAIQWILAVDRSAWLGWLAMALALSLFWWAFAWSSRLILRRLGWPLTVVAPVVWVALEYLRAHVLTGFPWYYLAHSQYRQIYWTQIADFSGSLGLSFLVVLVNAAIVELIAPTFHRLESAPVSASRSNVAWRSVPVGTRVRVGFVLLSLAGTLLYGVVRVEFAAFRPGPRVAMLQSGEFQEIDSKTRKTQTALHQLYLALIDKAVNHRPRPDLIVWPETAYPFGHVTIDPLLDPGDFETQARLYNPNMIAADWTLKRDRNAAEFRRILDRTRVPMMIGATTYQFRQPAFSRYNSAILMQPGSDPQSYHKLHLVPFGEYVPMIETFPWLAQLMPFPVEQMSTLSFGERPTWFTLGSLRLAAAICFEDTLPHIVRRFFAEVPDDAQPDLIVNLSNDGWFQKTAEHEMHLAVSTFRCIENRVPMVRAVNTGVSALIDGNGRIVKSLAKEVADQVLEGVAPLDDRTSLYSRWGDWLGQTTLAGTIGFVLLSGIAPRQRPLPPDPLDESEPHSDGPAPDRR